MSGEMAAAGDIATGMLVGRAVEPHAGEATHARHDHRLCLNCGNALRGEFCHACGQIGHVHRTLAAIGHDLLHGVFHFEGKIWRTLPMLFTRPGELTRRYIAGERARFVSPLALFLFSVFLMVATLGAVGGPIGGNSKSERDGVAMTPIALRTELGKAEARQKLLETERQVLLAKGGDTDKIDDQLKEVRSDVKGLTAARDLTEGKLAPVIAAESIHTGSESLDQRIKYAVKEPKLFLYKLQSNAYKFSWALVPISLPFIWILFAFRRDVGPYEHAIFAIYSISAMTVGATVLAVASAVGVPGGMIATIFVFGPPFHMYRQLKGAYRLSRFGALWRTFILINSATIAGLLFFILVLGIISGK